MLNVKSIAGTTRRHAACERTHASFLYHTHVLSCGKYALTYEEGRNEQGMRGREGRRERGRECVAMATVYSVCTVVSDGSEAA